MTASSETENLTINVPQQGPTTIVKLIGSANMVTSSDLKDKLLQLIKNEPRRLLLDLSELTFISSVGLGAIIAAHIRCRHHNSSIELIAPQPEILDLLSVTKLTSLFIIHESMAAALTPRS